MTKTIRPRRRSGNIQALKVEIWAAIRAASAVIRDPETDPELRLRAASAIATAGGVYLRILQGADTESRVADMERVIQEALDQTPHGHGPRDA